MSICGGIDAGSVVVDVSVVVDPVAGEVGEGVASFLRVGLGLVRRLHEACGGRVLVARRGEVDAGLWA
jgi:hypothetical protein